MCNRNFIIFGRNVGNVLGQIRSFGEIGVNTEIIWFGEMPQPVRCSKYVNSFHEVYSEEEGLHYLLENFGNNIEKDVLSTDNDGIVSLFDKHYDILKGRFIFFNAGQQGRLTAMMTKDSQCKLAAECGLNVPISEVVHVGELPSKIDYPIFTKSLDSFDFDWKSAASICNSEDDLKEYYSKRNPNSTVLLQSYIRKKNEYILQGISLKGGEEIYLPIEGSYYRLPKDAYGSYLYFKKFRGGDLLENKIRKFFRRIGYSGIFEMEFLVSEDGLLYFLEANFRHTLWNHTFTDMGINLCKIWVESVLNDELSLDSVVINKEPHNLMREFQDFLRCRRDGSRSLSDWLKDLHNTDSFVIWDKNDRKPFFAYIWYMFFREIKSHLK